MKSRLLLASLVAGALLGGAMVGGPAPGAAAGARPCSSSGLVIWAGEEPGGGAAGSVYDRVEFTNLSGRTCTLSGYPRVSAVDLKGRRIGAPARTEPGMKAQPVTLAPDTSATATLRIVDAFNFPRAKCGLRTAAGLRVGVPGGSGTKIAPLAFETCSVASTTTLSVAPVVASVQAG